MGWEEAFFLRRRCSWQTKIHNPYIWTDSQPYALYYKPVIKKLNHFLTPDTKLQLPLKPLLSPHLMFCFTVHQDSVLICQFLCQSASPGLSLGLIKGVGLIRILTEAWRATEVRLLVKPK